MLYRRHALLGSFALVSACVTSTEGPSTVSQAEPGTVPLPDTIQLNMAPANPSLPSELAAFVGKWGGKWNGTLASNLYVESIEQDGAVKGVYVWDTAPNFRPTRGASRFKGTIAKGILSWGTATKFEFLVRPDGKLQGSRSYDGFAGNTIIMTRMAS